MPRILSRHLVQHRLWSTKTTGGRVRLGAVGSDPRKLDSWFRYIPNLRRDTEMAKRRKFTDQFKAKVALEALRGDKAVQ